MVAELLANLGVVKRAYTDGNYPVHTPIDAVRSLQSRWKAALRFRRESTLRTTPF